MKIFPQARRKISIKRRLSAAGRFFPFSSLTRWIVNRNQETHIEILLYFPVFTADHCLDKIGFIDHIIMDTLDKPAKKKSREQEKKKKRTNKIKRNHQTPSDKIRKKLLVYFWKSATTVMNIYLKAPRQGTRRQTFILFLIPWFCARYRTLVLVANILSSTSELTLSFYFIKKN